MHKSIPIILVPLLLFILASCENKEPAAVSDSVSVSAFNVQSLKIPDKGGRKVRGQVLYMPIYSNLPYRDGKQYDLSAFLAIHNTDLKNKITITKVDFFNTEGKLIKNYIPAEQQIDPLATFIVTVPQKDQSGTGANFLVEWIADMPVSVPLIESVMKDLSGNLGLAFLSTGRIIREIE